MGESSSSNVYANNSGEQKLACLASVKEEYVHAKNIRKRKRKREINREFGKKIAKKSVDCLVSSVCEVKSEAIIGAVEQLPCIWDSACEDYRDRSKRKQSWSAVCRMLISDFDSKERTERQFIEKEIQNKWKNIRDCYVRDIRRKNGEPVKSRGKRTREYIHAGLLSFLKNCYASQRKTVQITTNDSQSSNEFLLDSIGKPFIDQGREVSCDWIKQEALEEKLGMILEERSKADDKYSSFFSSLLPAIQNMNAEQKIEFRMEVLQVLQQISAKEIVPSLFL
ncbi:unnamed protein product [Thelazia callipaeda]|uniref:BESS domain-containing protein n=1 Tax=Thelazia callipaeda TaxID=103827 RepID=A0A0N5D5I8_THECL|nr:unnamed protein product [Thelazia callipaeda]